MNYRLLGWCLSHKLHNKLFEYHIEVYNLNTKLVPLDLDLKEIISNEN